MEYWRRLTEFIVKDVENANETKRASVIMRSFSLIMCVYFLVQGICLMVCGVWGGTGIRLLCLMGYVGAFGFTYLNRTQSALFYTLFFTMVWVVLYVVLFGWDCGVQHFLFALLILFFAKFIMEQGYPTDVIIETGYADFDYAKTAIHYGVKEYIIKPLNGQELCDSVRKVLEERSRTGMEVFAFSDIVRNAGVCRQIFGREGSWGDRSFCMVLANGRDPVRDEPFLGELLRKHGEFKELRSFYFAGRNEGVWLAFSDERREVSGLFGRRAVLELKTHLPAQVQVSFSLWHGGIGELETAYSECVYAINERILRRERVFFYRQEKQMEEDVIVHMRLHDTGYFSLYDPSKYVFEVKKFPPCPGP